MKNKRNLPGFSLIELLVVMVIIGILSGIAVASFNHFKKEARVKKTVVFERNFDMLMKKTLVETGEYENFARGAWDFNDPSVDVVTDHSGNGNSTLSYTAGSNADVERTTDTPARSGYATKFTGLNRYILTMSDLPGDNTYRTNGFTISAWFKNENTPAGEPINLKDRGATNIFRAYFYKSYSAFPTPYTITSNGLRMYGSQNVGKIDEWYHVIWTFVKDSEDNSDWNFRTYVNGKLDDHIDDYPTYLYMSSTTNWMTLEVGMPGLLVDDVKFWLQGVREVDIADILHN